MSSFKMLNVTIDGKKLQVVEGMTILSAATMAGIKIPTLCYLAGVNEIGSCRVCVVEVAGRENLVASCNTQCEEGMEVLTDSERVIDARRMALALLLSQHGLDTTNYCFSCKKNGACELQALCFEYDVHEPLMKLHLPHKPVFDSNPFLSFDPNLCIKCQRCVSTCNKESRNHVLQTGRKGCRLTIEAPFGEGWDASICESCGNCAQACPTGALTMKRRKKYRPYQVEKKVLTTCPHCATGCQYYVLVKDELNVKLHPLLLKFFIDLFYNNGSMAQLIYTTHDTTLMDKKFFRRDQIWFVQKDELGHSELCALSDFKVRSDASFEKDYLAGVYGGIPFLKEFSLKEGE